MLAEVAGGFVDSSEEISLLFVEPWNPDEVCGRDMALFADAVNESFG